MAWRHGAATAFLLSALVHACSFQAGPSAPPADAGPGDAAAGPLSPGDRVTVAVSGHPDLSGTYGLDLDGTFHMPLIGRVDAYGDTPAALQLEIVARLVDGYLREPQVRVEAAALRPFFILGEVRRPGSYAFVPGMTVAAAIDEAGGPLAPEGRYDVLVAPAGRAGDTRIVELDAELAPGDIVELKDRRG